MTQTFEEGYNKALEEVEKLIDERYDNQNMSTSCHYILKTKLQELKEK